MKDCIKAVIIRRPKPESRLMKWGKYGTKWVKNLNGLRFECDFLGWGGVLIIVYQLRQTVAKGLRQ